jgi:exosortase family protein XrtF
LLTGGALLIVYELLSFAFRQVHFMRVFSVAARKILVKIIVYSTHRVLKALGEDASIYKNIVYIEHSDGVRVIFSCLGISLMVLFAGFIISYPGKRVSKYWYIPAGIGLILLMNIFRITGMALLSYHSPETLDFYHRYVFKYTLHGFILVLWIIWVYKFGRDG